MKTESSVRMRTYVKDCLRVDSKSSPLEKCRKKPDSSAAFLRRDSSLEGGFEPIKGSGEEVPLDYLVGKVGESREEIYVSEDWGKELLVVRPENQKKKDEFGHLN